MSGLIELKYPMDINKVLDIPNNKVFDWNSNLAIVNP